MPKRMTDKQLSANRRNALRSTGPRTAKGRAASRMNALKHGILSRQVLVKGRHYEESEAELEALHQRFHDEYQPSGPLEEMLLDQIVTAHWRLRRALVAESGEIALSVDNGKRRRDRGVSPTLQWIKWESHGDVVHNMEESSIGNSILLRWLGELISTVEAEGRLTGSAIQTLSGHFGNRPNSLTLSLERFREKMEAKTTTAEETGDAAIKTETLAFLNREINLLNHRLERCVEEEEQEDESRQDAAVLPSGEVLEKILRYETKLERQMYRAMAQLERVQRMRRGEEIPAPLSVEVSDRG